jgi:hypothetical protein
MKAWGLLLLLVCSQAFSETCVDISSEINSATRHSLRTSFESIEGLVGNKGFMGPNCHNTALRASGFLPRSEKRFVDQGELEAILKVHYDKVTEPKRGDLVIFYASRSREHSGVWLGRKSESGEPLVFLTYGFSEKEEFIIVPVSKACRGEVIEDRFSRKEPGFDEVAARDRAYYRLKRTAHRPEPFDPTVQRVIELIDYLHITIPGVAEHWSVGKTYGVVFDSFMSQVVKNFVKQTDNPHLRIKYEMLKSLREQVFASISRELFNSGYASTKEEQIRERNFVFRTPESEELLRQVALAQGARLSEESVDRIFASIEEARPDRLRRNRLSVWDLLMAEIEK